MSYYSNNNGTSLSSDFMFLLFFDVVSSFLIVYPPSSCLHIPPLPLSLSTQSHQSNLQSYTLVIMLVFIHLGSVHHNYGYASQKAQCNSPHPFAFPQNFPNLLNIKINLSSVLLLSISSFATSIKFYGILSITAAIFFVSVSMTVWGGTPVNVGFISIL